MKRGSCSDGNLYGGGDSGGDGGDNGGGESDAIMVVMVVLTGPCVAGGCFHSSGCG